MSDALDRPAEAPVSSPATIPPARSLRLWPGVVIVLLELTAIFVPSWVAPATFAQFMAMFWGPMIASALLAVWWMFRSRVAWGDKFLVLSVAILGGVATAYLVDKTVPFGLLLYGLPTVTTVWVAWLLVSSPLVWTWRRNGLCAAILLSWGYFTLVRFDGTYGELQSQMSWRWMPTAEQKFLAARPNAPTPVTEAAVEPLMLSEGDWPGFRGRERNSRLDGVTINPDWTSKPPPLVWKQRIGPGWGSFAVVGDRLFTQEQRGENEAVVCYSAADGAELWVHNDAVRFEEVVAGAGPRATPTFAEGRLFAFGAKGLLNCLDAATGAKIWSRDVAAETKAATPQWGFSSSPLVAGDVVVVLPAGPDDHTLAAYDAATGEPRWNAAKGVYSYSSPQMLTVAGIPQVLSMSDQGLDAVDAATGKELWRYAWALPTGMGRIVQPYVDGDRILVGTGQGIGSKLIQVSHSEVGWSTTDVWESKDLKPYYNDFVVLDGHAYGFDHNLFACVKWADGKRVWKKGRYGFGQVLLVADQKLLVVLTETGEAVLVSATPDGHIELGRFQAIEGKTWNHPVIVRGRLFVRNGEEMACYDVTP